MYYSSARFSLSSLSRWFTLCLPCVVLLSSVGVPADRDGTRVHDMPWMHRIHGRDAPRHCQPDAAIEIGIHGIASHDDAAITFERHIQTHRRMGTDWPVNRPKSLMQNLLRAIWIMGIDRRRTRGAGELRFDPQQSVVT